ncbi:hypothetical protein HHK36_004092 [Tetracentron sinense]|uniref:Uncharacterized protein n=1 Tax=Tetracentron sinense TaxID=13715 RepID=A0A835DP63_TETSI|nr:hypothetical protein HHK36_004092 [Tetracentron sinense]
MNKSLALPLLLLLLLSFSSGGKCGTYDFDPPGICKDKFDLFMEPRCANGECKALCEGKNFNRLYGSRCVDDSTCECTHLCPRQP